MKKKKKKKVFGFYCILAYRFLNVTKSNKILLGRYKTFPHYLTTKQETFPHYLTTKQEKLDNDSNNFQHAFI